MEELVILSNDRDRRVFAWLRDTAGDQAIASAVEQLAGERKPYLSNICKILNVTPPDNLARTDSTTARERLAGIKAMLQGK